MQIDLTPSTLSLFLIIVVVSSILMWWNYSKRESLKTTYTLLFTQSKIFYIRYILLIFSLIIMSVAIFKIWYFWSNTPTGKNLDVVFVLDVSKSMNTIDVENGSWSRLDYSKIKISEYMNQHPENRYGLVIFAGDALSLSPLSNNISHLLTNLSQVNFTNIVKQWTSLDQALELGYARFWISDSDTWKALILISDGWDSNDSLDLSILKNINSQNIPSFIFWVGSSSGGPIPIWKDPFWNIVFQTYQWQQVITRLNTDLLKQLADTIDGEYNLVSSLWNQLDHIATKATKLTQQKYTKSFAHILATFSFILFILYLIFPYIWKLKK